MSYKNASAVTTASGRSATYSPFICKHVQRPPYARSNERLHMTQPSRKFSKRLIGMTAAAALMALGAATAVQAQTTTRLGSDYSLYGPGSSYVGLNAGQSNFSVGGGTGVFSSEKKDRAIGVTAGSYFNNNFGAELGYTDFGSISRGGGNTKAQGINFSLIGRLPVATSFNLLGKVGATYGRTSVSSAPGSGITAGNESGFGLSYGIGAEYLFTPALSAVLQYDNHDLKFAGGGRDRVSATTLGLRYRF